jgi:type IV pilus assembly protein PilW
MSPIMQTNHCKLNSFNAAGMAGLSLVELMVSLTIGLFLLLGLATLLVTTSGSHKEMQKTSAQIENGRYATQLLTEDIKLAGYYGAYSPTGYNVPEKPCVVPVVPVKPNMPSPVGYDLTAAGADFDCMPDRQAGTGVLVLRRVQTFDTTLAAAGADGKNASYLQVSQCQTDSNATAFKFLVADTTPEGEFTFRKVDCLDPSDLTGRAALQKVLVHIYYISSCNVCDGTEVPPNPTLKMVEIGNDVADAPIALVEGIENMQFDYGIDADNNGSPDSYVAAPALAQWDDVMAVRINLLARNIERTAGHNDGDPDGNLLTPDGKVYNLGLFGTVGPFIGSEYKRHAYTSLVRVENPSARRESP